MIDTSKALEFADQLQSMVCVHPQTSEEEPGGYCSQQDEALDAAAEMIRRLAAVEKAYELVQKDCHNLTEKVIPNIREERDALKAELERIRSLPPVGIIDENGRAWAYSNHGGKFELPSGTRVYTLPPNLKG